MKRKLPQIVLVTWADAYEIGCEEQETLEELEELKAHCTYTSVGFLPLPESENVILIADIEVDKSGRPTAYRGGSVIPRQCVLSIEKIGRKK